MDSNRKRSSESSNPSEVFRLIYAILETGADQQSRSFYLTPSETSPLHRRASDPKLKGTGVYFSFMYFRGKQKYTREDLRKIVTYFKENIELNRTKGGNLEGHYGIKTGTGVIYGKVSLVPTADPGSMAVIFNYN